MKRCSWAGPDEIYVRYHDTEWGVPQRDGRALWEQLTLEGFQSGLSWITILKKRENFRAAFANFDPKIIAMWGNREIERLLNNDGIVRHRGKIEATINNARRWIEIENTQGFSDYIWSFVDFEPIINRPENMTGVAAKTEIATNLAKDLKKRGFKFCGPTTVYAFMQASGLVCDHLIDCPCHPDNQIR